jgi:hypothetical protein
MEPEWDHTFDCMTETGMDVFLAKRDGVGNMSRAFNEKFKRCVDGKYDYVWFITNIRFHADVPAILSQCMEDEGWAAIHPGMASSDHLHLRPDNSIGAREVPFIEFTAPMFRTDVFSKYFLDENLWYYYMDLLISWQMRQAGEKMAVHNSAIIEHTYLRNNKTTHPITAIRKQLRDYMSKQNQQYLNEMFGSDWRQFFGWEE